MLDERTRKELKERVKQFDDYAKDGSTKKILRKWLRDHNFEVLPLKGEHLSDVFDKYFSGEPPYKSVKDRGSIPDAFIYQGIVEFFGARESEKHCICDDGALFSALSSDGSVNCHKTLKEFLEEKPVREQMTLAAQKDERIEGRLDELLDDFVNTRKKELRKKCADLIRSEDADLLSDPPIAVHGLKSGWEFVSAQSASRPSKIKIIKLEPVYGTVIGADAEFVASADITYDAPLEEVANSGTNVIYLDERVTPGYRRVTERKRVRVTTDIRLEANAHLLLRDPTEPFIAPHAAIEHRPTITIL